MDADRTRFMTFLAMDRGYVNRVTRLKILFFISTKVLIDLMVYVYFKDLWH